jgi:hypothetical protein
MKKILLIVPLFLIIGWFAYTSLATKTLEYRDADGEILFTAAYPAKYSFDPSTGIISATRFACKDDTFFSKLIVADNFSGYENYTTSMSQYGFLTGTNLEAEEGIGGTSYSIFRDPETGLRYSAVRFSGDTMIEILYPKAGSCVRRKYDVEREMRLMLHTIRYDDTLVDFNE